MTSPTTANRITVTAPAQTSSVVDDHVLLSVRATSSGHRPVQYAATDLPAGLEIDATTGTISGRPTAPGTHSVTITATDSTGARGNAVVNWIVSTQRGSHGVVNGDFESGTGGWSETDVIHEDGQYAAGGLGYAWLGGHDTAHTDSVSQRIAVPSVGRPRVQFALWVHSDDPSAANNDVLRLAVDARPVRAVTAEQSGGTYVDQSVDLTPYRGRTVTLTWTSTEDDATPTSFLLDDVSVTP